MSTRATPVAIIGTGWTIPGLSHTYSLAEACESTPKHESTFDPASILGKKGLRYKDRATVLALCAGKVALDAIAWDSMHASAAEAESFGVVIATNTGNLDTVCQAASTIRQKHVNATSPMDLANASSNNAAATVAIRFGLKALNLTICSGSSASFDALVIAANAIRNGRVKRMLVIAVETDGPALRSLLAGQRLNDSLTQDSPIFDGAVAAVLSAAEIAQKPDSKIFGWLSDYAYQHTDSAIDAAQPFTVGQRASCGLFGATAYGASTLLQMVRFCEPGHPKSGSSDGTVLLTGGGTWNDRRTGTLVLARNHRQ